MKIPLTKTIALFCFMCSGATGNASAQTAPVHPVFYLHGFNQNSTQIDPLAVGMQSAAHFNWTTKGEEPDYYAKMFTPNFNIPFTASYVKSLLLHSSDYVGVGYSSGGLVGRSVVHNTAGTGYMNGMVTINTPNTGSWMANNLMRVQYAQLFGAAQGQIGRADWSFLSTVASTIINALFAIPELLVSSLDQLINVFMADMNPGSGYLNGINAAGGAPQLAELALGGGVASCFGTVSSPLAPANNATSATGASGIASMQQAWRDKIQAARDKSSYYANESSRLHSKLHWWNAVVLWPRIWWNNTRAGDYHAAADGIVSANDAWEIGVGALGGTSRTRLASDSFILLSSQLGDPAVPTANKFLLNADGSGQCTHGLAPFNFGNNFSQIEMAMRSVGAH